MNIRLTIAALAALALPGCVTTPDGSTALNWHKIDIAGDEIISMIDGQIIAWAHRPEVVEDLLAIRELVRVADDAVGAIIEGGGGVADLDSALVAAAALIDTLAAETDDPDMRAVYSTLRAALGAIRVGIA